MRTKLWVAAALCAVVGVVGAQTAAADATTGMTPSFAATGVATCNGSTTMTVTLDAQDPAAIQRPMDVMWVLDESGSIRSTDFARVKTSVQSWGNAQTFGTSAVMAGVVQFADAARYSVPLTMVKGSFVNAVGQVLQRQGNTNIGAGIELARTTLYAYGRSTAPDVMIVETDGQNNVQTSLLASRIAAAKSAGITIFAVGVGPDVLTSQLEQIASKPEYVFSLADYASLEATWDAISTLLNPAATDASYQVTAAPGWELTGATATTGTVTASSATGFSWSAPELRTGTATITYTLRHTGTTGGALAPQQAATLSWKDVSGAAQQASYAAETVQVDGCNQPPTANAGADRTVQLSGSPQAAVTLDGSGSTDDGQVAPLTYAWSEGGTAIASGATPTVSLGLGHHTLVLTVGDGQYSATDEVVFDVVDPTAPVLTPSLAGTLGTGGWYRSDVTVSWAVSDPESPVTGSTGCGPATVSADTAGVSFTCSATSAGGTATATSPTVRRDATPPSVVYTGNAGSYGVADTVSISCAANDALSGVASSTCAPISGPAYSFGPGSHTFSATAKDVAGNSGSGSVTFRVDVDAAGVCNLARGWVGQAGVANSLCTKLQHGSTGAFVNEVNAQRGKRLTATEADVLIRLARGL